MKIRRSASGLFTRVFYDDGTDEIVPTQASSEFIEKFFREQSETFKDKFGRYPNPEDPLPFDGDSKDPVPVSENQVEKWILEMLDEKGIPAHDRYAFQMTGHLVNSETKPMMTPEEIIRWFAAVSAWEQDNNAEVFGDDGVTEEVRSTFNEIKRQHYLIVDKITERDPDNFISKLVAEVLLSSCALNYRMFSDAGYLICEAADYISYCVPEEEQNMVWREFVSLVFLLLFQHIQRGIFRNPDQMDLAMAMADVFNSDVELVEIINKFELSETSSQNSLKTFEEVLKEVLKDPFMALGVAVGALGSLMHTNNLSAGLSFEILHLPGRRSFRKLEGLLQQLENDSITVDEFGEKIVSMFPFFGGDQMLDSFEEFEQEDDFMDIYEDEDELSEFDGLEEFNEFNKFEEFDEFDESEEFKGFESEEELHSFLFPDEENPVEES